jgi:putative ABC transport system permease protein
MIAFYDALARETRSLPGVEAAAVVSQVPLSAPTWSSQFAVEGREPIPAGSHVVHRELTPGYQQVMRVPVRHGRLFTEADREGAPMTVLINETLAATYFKDEPPVGKRITFDRLPDSASTWRTIVGVVGDERQTGLGQPVRAEFLAPYAQDARNAMTLVVRSQRDPELLAPLVRQVIARLDPLLAITSIRTMEDVRAASLGRDRFLTVLMLSFAGVGLVLCIVGVYGVVAQLARRRMREMGIRIALGANAGQVQWLVVRHGMLLTAVGIVAGVSVALGTTGIIRTLLFQVAPADPATFVAVPAMVLLTAAVASWVPARRASRADPCQVLRSD